MPMNITEVRLCAVPLENDYKHTFSFPDAASQLSYFNGKVVHSGANFSYQRKDNVIRYPKHFDDLQNCNYVMYKNSAYSNKWFYSFITDMEYINDEMTAIHIETDVMQTYMFDYTLQPSFVEREHCIDDSVGAHTIDEGLETGEYIVNTKNKLNYGDGFAVIVGVTKTPDGLINSGGQVHGIYTGLMYYVLENDLNGASVNNFINQYDAAGVGEAIACMFLVPKNLATKAGSTISYNSKVPNSALPNKTIINKPYSSWVGFDYEVEKTFSDSTIDGYTPKNKKLLCYPYRYLLVSNNAGGAATYKFEKFYTEDDNGNKTIIEPSFEIDGCLTPGCSIRIIPRCYNGTGANQDEGLNMGKFPILNWTSDVYTNWLTQNSINIAVGVVGGLAVAGASAATIATGGAAAAGLGAVVGGVSQIGSTLAQVNQQSFTPPQVQGNINASDVITAMNDNAFFFYSMSVKKEFAKIIDGYFDMFGYKCNLMKIPNKRHRASWWYTKTIDVSIDGAIPMKDMQKIKSCYDNGITFWMNGSVIGDYSQDNSIIE